jgi:hypothetical protein
VWCRPPNGGCVGPGGPRPLQRVAQGPETSAKKESEATIIGIELTPISQNIQGLVGADLMEWHDLVGIGAAGTISAVALGTGLAEELSATCGQVRMHRKRVFRRLKKSIIPLIRQSPSSIGSIQTLGTVSVAWRPQLYANCNDRMVLPYFFSQSCAHLEQQPPFVGWLRWPETTSKACPV